MASERHLHLVSANPARAEEVASLRRALDLLTERRDRFAHQQQAAREAAAAPDVVADRDDLVARTAYRLRPKDADVRALLTELATAMYVHGYMDASGEQRPMADATLATIIRLEDVEQRIRAEAEQKLRQTAGEPA